MKCFCCERGKTPDPDVECGCCEYVGRLMKMLKEAKEMLLFVADNGEYQSLDALNRWRREYNRYTEEDKIGDRILREMRKMGNER